MIGKQENCSIIYKISFCVAFELPYNLTTWTAMESGNAVKIGTVESDGCEAETHE